MPEVVPPYPSLLGARLGGRYLVEALVGRGAASEVYRAEDLWQGGAVAVKVLRAGAADPIRFHREVDLLRRLRHEHLVSLRDAGEHRGLPYVVLDLLDRTLADAMAAGPLAPDDAARLGAQVAAALAYVHGAGIVHRDVKPSNLLLAADGSARLADLGAARLVDGGGLTLTGTTIGTPAYLAPEQVASGAVGPPADVYSLGLVLIEAVGGRRVFEGTQPELLAARLSRRPAIPPAIPGSWRPLVAGMTDLDPTRRPTAAEVAARLDPGALAGAGDDTAVLPVGAGGGGTGVPGAVGGVGAADTVVLPAPPAPTPAAAGPDRGLGGGASVRRWVADHSGRAALWAVLAVVLLGLVAGLASAGGWPEGARPVGAVTQSTTSTVTTTTLPSTTVPTTVAAVPPPGPCREDCEARDGPGRGKPKEKDEKKPGKKGDDD